MPETQAPLDTYDVAATTAFAEQVGAFWARLLARGMNREEATQVTRTFVRQMVANARSSKKGEPEP